MCEDRALYQELFYVFMYFDMFYIQLHHLPRKDLWNKVYEYIIITIIIKTYHFSQDCAYLIKSSLDENIGQVLRIV
jgi:uncharacterized membrane protein